MSVTLFEPGLIELLEAPTGPVTRYVTARAEAVAEIARENVRSTFVTRTGKLHDSIGIFPDETIDGVSYEIGTDGAPYGRVLEVGGEPHEIYAVNTPLLWSLRMDPNHPNPLTNNMLTVVNHPGPLAKPWLEPALRTVFNDG